MAKFNLKYELIFALAAAVSMAAAVTLPYFTQLERVTTMGDVQRALVYRGVAREGVLQGGKTALWDPYLCGGEPLLANAESAQFDPWFLLVLAFGENLGARLSVPATLVLGFLGVYFLSRFVGLTRLPALLAAMIFPFSGFQMLAFANGNFAWLSIGWIPWFLLFYLMSLERARWLPVSALAAAFIWLGGSAHMTVYVFLLAGFMAVALAIQRRQWRPILMLTMAGVMAMLFSAIKLIPAAEVQALSGDFSRPPGFIPPWSWIPKMFWDRSQLATEQWTFEATGENFRWIEYGAYVGVVPALLFFFGLMRVRRRTMWLAIAAAAVLLFPMIFGWYPWLWLKQVPFLDEILRNPQRARSVWLLAFGLLAGLGLMNLTRNRWVWAGVVALVLVDLATFHSGLYSGLFNLERPALERKPAFERHLVSYTDEERGYYKLGYENYLANQGTTDLCNPYLVQRGVHARGIQSSDPARPYLGEAYLTEGGEAKLAHIETNRLVVAAEPERAGWLIMNQNYFPGWKTDPPREVKNFDGRLAARVFPEDREIIFEYRPRSYAVGRAITLVALAGGIIWWRKYRYTTSAW